MTTPFDIVALGESLLRLTPPMLQRLGQNSVFDVHVGGSESNTLSAMSRLGLNCTWLSRLPDTELGDMVRECLAQHGVNTEHVTSGGSDRMGLYFYEPGKRPFKAQVIYDRANSAAAKMSPNDLPEALFRSHNVRMFHTTGITLGLSESARMTVESAISLAKAEGVKVSFDINYRQKLWSPEHARECLESVLSAVDLVLVAERDIETLWPELFQPTARATLEGFQHLAPEATVVMTRGKDGAALLSADGHYCVVEAFEATEVERLGGGDAFAAGFLTAWLEGQSHQVALLWGAAVAAYKYATPGDVAWVSRHQVESLISGATSSGVLR